MAQPGIQRVLEAIPGNCAAPLPRPPPLAAHGGCPQRHAGVGPRPQRAPPQTPPPTQPAAAARRGTAQGRRQRARQHPAAGAREWSRRDQLHRSPGAHKPCHICLRGPPQRLQRCSAPAPWSVRSLCNTPMRPTCSRQRTPLQHKQWKKKKKKKKKKQMISLSHLQVPAARLAHPQRRTRQQRQPLKMQNQQRRPGPVLLSTARVYIARSTPAKAWAPERHRKTSTGPLRKPCPSITPCLQQPPRWPPRLRGPRRPLGDEEGHS
mmetsp:Transcript_25760/g.83238  ORF Transcript_25760/g.83238 Transcript_25760/m.83238 type:complete len:264 (-) Transcript_25760:2-793(-)